MAPAAQRPDRTTDHDQLLPLLAVERGRRATILIGVGVILLTHAHLDWADLARRYAEQIG